jgi:hypothetical protein
MPRVYSSSKSTFDTDDSGRFLEFGHYDYDSTPAHFRRRPDTRCRPLTPNGLGFCVSATKVVDHEGQVVLSTALSDEVWLLQSPSALIVLRLDRKVRQARVDRLTRDGRVSGSCLLTYWDGRPLWMSATTSEIVLWYRDRDYRDCRDGYVLALADIRAGGEIKACWLHEYITSWTSSRLEIIDILDVDGRVFVSAKAGNFPLVFELETDPNACVSRPEGVLSQRGLLPRGLVS